MNPKNLYEEALKIKEHLIKRLNCKILGPVEAPIFRIKKKYRYRILIRAKKDLSLQQKLQNALDAFKIQPGIKLAVDVDPINFN